MSQSGVKSIDQHGMSLPKKFLSVNGERTFQYDDELPSLPVPPLQETLAKYLQSVRPHVTEEEFRRTVKTVDEFGKGIGRQLHLQLLETAKHQRNWLEKWWTDYGYLLNREPHAPFVNYCGNIPFNQQRWPPKEGTQIERAALFSWFQLKFWELLRKETFRVDRGVNGSIWSMNQFLRIYNACKIPGATVDELQFHFRTEREGKSPTHLLVICRGRYFTFETLDSEGNLITVPELENQLRRIRSRCDGRPEGSGIGAMTGENRSVWHRIREHVISVHPDNKRHLEDIQRSIFILVLDDSSPKSRNEVIREGLIGNSRLRWFDKAYSSIFFRNGMLATNGDHAPVDGMVNQVIVSFVKWALEACDYRWLGSNAIRDLPNPKELEFHLDDKTTRAISAAHQLHRRSNDMIDVLHMQYEGFGKKFIRQHKFHPDALVHMALQYAYHKLHHRPASTYATATTRKFYNGRTETLRSCTQEVLEWSRSMMDDSVTDSKRFQLLLKALNLHLENMNEAKEGRGCDRHLMGLLLTAMESNLPTPELFLDPSWKKSGGGGNFILSTSFVGYESVIGCVTPMCKDGYGVFNSIEDDRVNAVIVCWTADDETSSVKLRDAWTDSLTRIKRLIETNSSDTSRL